MGVRAYGRIWGWILMQFGFASKIDEKTCVNTMSFFKHLSKAWYLENFPEKYLFREKSGTKGKVKDEKVLKSLEFEMKGKKTSDIILSMHRLKEDFIVPDLLTADKSKEIYQKINHYPFLSEIYRSGIKLQPEKPGCG